MLRFLPDKSGQALIRASFVRNDISNCHFDKALLTTGSKAPRNLRRNNKISYNIQNILRFLPHESRGKLSVFAPPYFV